MVQLPGLRQATYIFLSLSFPSHKMGIINVLTSRGH